MQKHPTLEDPDSLITEKGVAKHVNASVSLVRKMRHNGEGPPFIRLGGKLVRYLRADVEVWLAAQRRQPTAKALAVLQK